MVRVGGCGRWLCTQVESFLAVLRASGVLRPGARIVDLGSGSGNLALPLAYLLPECEVVAVDMKATAIELLNERIASAALTNIRAVCGDIEQARGVCVSF